jgi:excinuclease UvrABC ATPase subunit
MKFNIPPQINRLVLAFAIFISLFMVARHFLRPVSFGEKGHYRAAALIENAMVEIHYSGQQACFECHQNIEDLKAQDVHSDIHCETCHGPGQKHVLSSEAADILKPSGREFCGSCHTLNAARSKSTVNQVDLSKHNIGKNCIECHNPHQPWEMKK